jgi:Domain of unknown function (DUF4114)/PEP-CTERM motif
MRFAQTAFAFALALANVSQALAAPIDQNNLRQVPIGTSSVASEAKLQDILTGGPSFPNTAVFPGSTLDVTTDQSTYGMFGMATNPGTSIPTFVAEYTANAGSQIFGIWFGTDTSAVLTYDLFTGAATRGTNTGISIFGNTLEVIGSSLGASLSTCGQEVNCGVVTDTRINANAFGFYFKPSANTATYFSLDQLNAGNERRVLSFQNGATTNWAFAYEDGITTTGGQYGDHDYNDMVVKVESLVAVAVPEPSTLALMLAGLTGLALRRRT